MMDLMFIKSTSLRKRFSYRELSVGMAFVGVLVFSLALSYSSYVLGNDDESTTAKDVEYLTRVPLNAEKTVGLLWPDVSEFSPALKKTVSIDFAIRSNSLVTLSIHGPDGETVRLLIDKKDYKSGNHTVLWDGKDDDGLVVPDEVWVPVLSVVEAEGQTIVDDARRYSGGEIIPDIRWTSRADTELSFDVPFPARVLIRTGIDEGPMMRVLKRWEPVAAGKVVVRWDGFDANGVDEFAVRDDKWFVVMAYQLPEFALISTGNRAMSYRDYREEKGWQEPEVDLSQIKLQRDGIRLSRDYSLPRTFHPGVTIALADELEVSRTGLPVVKDSVRFKIDVPPEDRWVLDSSFYETGFYINYQFQSEEEQGFVPMIWDLDASSLAPGRHVATVQLFGFGGFITSATMAFEVLR